MNSGLGHAYAVVMTDNLLVQRRHSEQNLYGSTASRSVRGQVQVQLRF